MSGDEEKADREAAEGGKPEDRADAPRGDYAKWLTQMLNLTGLSRRQLALQTESVGGLEEHIAPAYVGKLASGKGTNDPGKPTTPSREVAEAIGRVLAHHLSEDPQEREGIIQDAMERAGHFVRYEPPSDKVTEELRGIIAELNQTIQKMQPPSRHIRRKPAMMEEERLEEDPVYMALSSLGPTRKKPAITLSGGMPCGEPDERNQESLDYMDEIGGDYITRVQGDSCAPDLRDGDEAIISRNIPPIEEIIKREKLLVVTYRGETFCRRLVSVGRDGEDELVYLFQKKNGNPSPLQAKASETVIQGVVIRRVSAV